MKILVIEDEKRIADSIKKGLVQESFSVDIAYEGDYGYDLASSESYDAIILDLMLPGMDGVTICRKLREEKIVTPILMLTAKGRVDEKVEGLNAGADDYLTKPFSFSELLARVRALVRRPPKLDGNILKADDLTLDTMTYEVKRGEKRINLSKKEYALLYYLMRNKGKVVSKEQIIENVWSFEDDILPNTVEVYIGYLRKKIDRAFKERAELIQTVRGFGYKIVTQ